jgi:hypothetical protein
MTKSKQSFVNNPAQLSLFDCIKREQEERTEKRPGRMCVTTRLQAAIKAAIKAAPKSVEQIADDMSELICGDVTASMIYNITSTSHSHKLPCDLLPAFCEATGDYRPLLVLTDTAGIHTIEAPDKIRARLQKLEEQKKELDKEKHRYASLLHELERKS